MEPRVFTRGNRKTADIQRSIFGRFNGATRLHAWKRVINALIAAPEYVLQWSHASSRVETLDVSRRSLAADNASMEPRVFTRGNRERIRKAGPSHPGFNGATRLHAW